jgi:cytochrome c556
MTRFVKFVSGFAIVAVLAASALPLVARADDKDAIDYRENIMKSLEAQTTDLGMIVSTQIPDDNLLSHTKALAILAKQAQKSFESKVPGGDAKPELWANYADFQKRMDDFVAKTADMAASAEKGGMPVVMEKMVPALTCKGCHDLYRVKK